MIVSCFLIAIATGIVAASFTVAAGYGFLLALLAYSLAGSMALLLAMAIATAVWRR